jgi:PIN domain nuclease of toxin-antitoxin system
MPEMSTAPMLDTHIWIWSLIEPVRLTEGVRAALDTDDNELWLSPISTWETLMLVERGRIATEEDPQDLVSRMLKEGPFREASLTHAVAQESRRLSLEHSDPADRFVAATAVVYDLTLVTADARLLRGQEYRTLPNL